MLECSPEQRQALTAAINALTRQVSACVPLYQNEAGTVLVPLHPLLETAELDLLLEATALTLLQVHACTLAQGDTALMVPLGEALALLPLSRHFPEALTHVLQIVAVRTTAEPRGADEVQGPLP
jgi:hypothetical protein